MTNLTNKQLRERLCAVGYDVPVDFNRKYLLKFLAKKEKERGIDDTPKRVDAKAKVVPQEYNGSGDYVRAFEEEIKGTTINSSEEKKACNEAAASREAASTTPNPMDPCRQSKSGYSKTPATGARKGDSGFESSPRADPYAWSNCLDSDQVPENPDPKKALERVDRDTSPSCMSVPQQYGFLRADSHIADPVKTYVAAKSTVVTPASSNDQFYSKVLISTHHRVSGNGSFIGINGSHDCFGEKIEQQHPDNQPPGPPVISQKSEADKKRRSPDDSAPTKIAVMVIILFIAFGWKNGYGATFQLLLNAISYGIQMITGLLGCAVSGVNKIFHFQLIKEKVLYGLKIIVFSAAGGLSLYLAWYTFQVYRESRKQELAEMFGLVEKVVEILEKQHESSLKSDGGVPSFLAINHIRDELLPPKERISKAFLWSKIVQYISAHESRVMEEVRHISGVEFKTWRWLSKKTDK